MLCVRFTPAIHFYRYALRSVRACCLPPVRQTERLAECFVPIPPWVVIVIRAFSRVIRLSGVYVSLWRSRRRTRGRRDAGNGVGGAAWAHFCANTLALPCFPRGVRWGKMRKPHCGRAPNLRQRVECGSRTAASLDSLHLIRGRVPLAKHSNNCYSRTAAPTSRSTRVHGKTRPSPIYARAGRTV